MQKILVLVGVLALVFAVGACNNAQKKEEAPAAPAATEQAAPMEAPATVEVSPEGTTFDPPVAVDKLPDGAWYCVDQNGMVTWAATEKAEGQLCPDGQTQPMQKMAAHEEEGEMAGHDEATEAGEGGEHEGH